MGLLDDYFLKQYYNRPNRVPENQKIFKGRDVPIYLKGQSDKLLYRGAMGLTVVGVGITLVTVVMMATNQMKKARS